MSWSWLSCCLLVSKIGSISVLSSALQVPRRVQRLLLTPKTVDDECHRRLVSGKVSSGPFGGIPVQQRTANVINRQAGDIVAQLKAGIALKCTVVRDGKEAEVEARDLVPGDIVVLEEGATIAADAKVS